MQLKPATRVPFIDVLRGVAASSVVIFHAREILWIGGSEAWKQYGLTTNLGVLLGYLSLPFSFGFAGVILFFVLSGYCISASLSKLFEQKKSLSKCLVPYLKRRVMRIYPTLFGALVLTATVDYFIRLSFPSQHKLGDNSPSAFLFNLLTLQGIASRSYGTNIPLWSLSIEEHLYLIFPLLFGLMRSVGIYPVMAVASVITLAGVISVTAGWIGFLDFIPYLAIWLMGVVIHLKGNEILRDARTSKLFTGFLVGTLVGCLLIKTNANYFGNLVLGVSFSLLLILGIRKTEFKENGFSRSLAFIGKFSYSLYAIHYPVLVAYRCWVLKDMASPHAGHIFTGTLTCVAAAYLFFILVEKRSLPVLNSGTQILPQIVQPQLTQDQKTTGTF